MHNGYNLKLDIVIPPRTNNRVRLYTSTSQSYTDIDTNIMSKHVNKLYDVLDNDIVDFSNVFVCVTNDYKNMFKTLASEETGKWNKMFVVFEINGLCRWLFKDFTERVVNIESEFIDLIRSKYGNNVTDIKTMHECINKKYITNTNEVYAFCVLVRDNKVSE